MKAAKLIAWNLRRLRLQRGLSQEALAADAEVDRSYTSRLERGLENPTVGVLERFAEAMDVSLAQLFAAPSGKALPPKPLKSGRKPSR